MEQGKEGSSNWGPEAFHIGSSSRSTAGKSKIRGLKAVERKRERRKIRDPSFFENQEIQLKKSYNAPDDE